jgi:hypothetical protein
MAFAYGGAGRTTTTGGTGFSFTTTCDGDAQLINNARTIEFSIKFFIIGFFCRYLN